MERSIKLAFYSFLNLIIVVGPIVKDVTPPIILQPDDIVVEAETSEEVTQVTFNVLAEDDVDKKIEPICKPSSGYLFGIGNTIVKCTAKNSAGDLQLLFPLQLP